MEIELNRLSAVETPIHGELWLSDDPSGSLARDGIRFPEPFRLDGGVRLDRGQVLVHGHVSGSLQLECGRCLGPVRQAVDLDFEARYADAARAPRGDGSLPSPPRMTPTHGDWQDDDGVMLAREDLDVSFLPHGTSVLRLEDVVREQVLLELPLRPLCRPDCAGLCPQCGADQNQGDCGCPPESETMRDLRLAGLALIKKKLDGA